MQSSTGRFILAIALMIGVIVGTNILFPPAPPPPSPEMPDDSAAALADDTLVADGAEQSERTRPADSAATGAEPGGPADAGAGVSPPRGTSAQSGDTAIRPTGPLDPFASRQPDSVAAAAAGPPADTVWVETELYRYGISTAGGSIVRAELLDFESFTREGPVQLAHAELGPLLAYGLQVDDRTLDFSSLAFDVVAHPVDSGDLLVLRHVDEARRFAVDITYEFDPERYLVSTRVRTTDLGSDASLLLHLPATLAINEINPEEDERALAYVFNSRDGVSSVSLSDVEGPRIEEGPLVWGAVRNKYFMVAALAGGEAAGGAAFGGLIAEPMAEANAADLALTLPGSDDTYTFRLYIGPQEHGRLAAVGQDLQNISTYGWEIFQPIVQPLADLVLWALDGLHDILGFGYGWILIIFGVLIRLVLWPLNAKAMRSQLKTMELQPVIKEIQAKHKNEPEKMQREMLRLYKEEGFSPLGGCLPMLIPWPVLITLFFVFQNTIAFRGVSFLWLPDLSQPDPLYILPLLMGGSIFVLQWLNLKAAGPQPNPQMKMLTYFMPIMMVVIFFNLASGLNLYYAASNLASLPQQLQIMAERRKVRSRMAT